MHPVCLPGAVNVQLAEVLVNSVFLYIGGALLPCTPNRPRDLAGLRADLPPKWERWVVVSMSAWKYKALPLLPGVCTVGQQTCIFFNLSFASSALRKAILHISYQYWLQLNLGFPNCLCMPGLCLCFPSAGPSSPLPLCIFSCTFELSQDFLYDLCWPSVMPALLSAHQNGLFCYLQKAVFEDCTLGHFGMPGLSLMSSYKDVSQINQNMLSWRSRALLTLYIYQDCKCHDPMFAVGSTFTFSTNSSF